MDAQPGIYAPGTVLDDKLLVERLLGEGGMGAVYEVTHQLTHHRRALKLLHPQFARQKESVERFLREASAAGRVGNAHIIETFDAGWLSSGEPFLLMELLAGETLAERLAQCERMSLADTQAIFAQLCRGVQAAHEAGIIHRDLKPENIFLATPERGVFVKVLDFGVSKFDERHTLASQPTQRGATIGTPGYMSLEQIDDSAEVDERSDIYALGVILYQMTTGTHPYPATSFLQLAKKVAAGTFIAPSQIQADLPPELDALMGGLLTPKREDRLGSVTALAAQLAELSSAPVIDESMAIASAASLPEVTVAMPDPITVPQPPTIGKATATVASDAKSDAIGSRPSMRWLALAAGAAAIALGVWSLDQPPAPIESARDASPSATAVEPIVSATSSSVPYAPSASGSARANAPKRVRVAPRPPPAKPTDPDDLGSPDDL